MVVARFYTPIDMSDPTTFEGSASGDASHISITDGYYTGIYYGAFKYNRDGYLSGGTVTGYRQYEGSTETIYISDGKFSVNEISYIQTYGTTYDLYAYIFSGNDTIYGSTGIDHIGGFNGNDTLYGGDDDDFLDEFYYTGNDYLDGGTGADVMAGGRGNDTYRVDNMLDEAYEVAGHGTDSIQASVSYTLSDQVENLTLLEGFGDLGGTGNDLINTIIGNSGNNELAGGAGKDILRGEAGNDTYLVDLELYKNTLRLQDSIIEKANGGNDTIVLQYYGSPLGAVSSIILANEIENLDASQFVTNQSLNLTGNAAANILKGNNAANIIDGGLGADMMYGAVGDDFYIFDTLNDKAVEQGGEGIDTIRLLQKNMTASAILIDMTTTDFDEIENLTLAGTGLFNINGNALNNTLIGNASQNSLIGGDGNDILDGGSGADWFAGNDGDDTYVIDNALDDIIGQDDGIDTVCAFINYTLGGFQENLTLAGKALTATGNALDNTLIGNAYNNTLDGRGGQDTMSGGLGNDTYLINDLDVIIESVSSGIDQVISNINFTLGANLENLTLVEGFGNLEGTGNELVNMIIGNSGNNILAGAGGKDMVRGGAGDDTYLVNLELYKNTLRLEDTVTEIVNQGMDTLILDTRGIDFGLVNAATVILSANVENMDGSSTGLNKLNFIGNVLNNIIQGNDTDNIMDGGTGVDDMYGNDGNDTYIFDTALDIAHENINEGIDTIRLLQKAPKNGAISFTIGDDIENVEIIGTGAYTITGNALGNRITANASFNNLIGGDGDDIYVVSNLLHSIVEMTNEGIDTIITTMTSGAYTLGSEIENLTAHGSGNLILMGNDLNNNITGNSGANTLYGAIGVDTLAGGLGNDTYIIDQDDILIEAIAAGTDTVQAAFTYILATDFENLTLLGFGAIDGTGNAQINVITGNGGNNILNGLGGVDTLTGGAGDDTYHTDLIVSKNIAKFEDKLVEAKNQGNDTIILHGDVVLTKATTLVLAATFENLDARDTGSSWLNITGNAVDNVLHGNNASNVFNGGKGADTFVFQTSSPAVDVIGDFKVSDNDRLDISDLLIGYDSNTSVLSDYVSFSNGMLAVDPDGGGDNFTNVVIINLNSGLDALNIIDHLITTA